MPAIDTGVDSDMRCSSDESSGGDCTEGTDGEVDKVAGEGTTSSDGDSGDSGGDIEGDSDGSEKGGEDV